LNALSNIAINYKVLHTPEARSNEEAANRIRNAMISAAENADGIAVPVTEFTETAIRQHLAASMIHTLTLFGLECRQRTPDFKAIDHFLRNRYKYWTDDIEHDEIFVESAIPATAQPKS
jgi:hypothetical protein